jgi:hypothetical protein
VESLADQYLRNRSNVATWQGRSVFGLVRVHLDAPTSVTVDFDTDLPHLVQGIALRFVRRAGRTNGRTAERLILWEDAAAFPVTIDFVAKRPPYLIHVWNVWQGPHEATMAWLNNAGLVVNSDESGRLVLGCSAGPGDVRLHDSRITLTWDPNVIAQLDTSA